MDTVKFIKSFSHGQITIPKEYRDVFGIGDDFWLRLYIQGKKLIAEPVEIEENKKDYYKKISAIKGNWFSYKEFQKNRKEVEEIVKKDLR